VYTQRGRAGEQAAKHLFAFSILYLALLFAALLADRFAGLGQAAA
jgi:heme O synthase-like polyprenyltransferase